MRRSLCNRCMQIASSRPYDAMAMPTSVGSKPAMSRESWRHARDTCRHRDDTLTSDPCARSYGKRRRSRPCRSAVSWNGADRGASGRGRRRQLDQLGTVRVRASCAKSRSSATGLKRPVRSHLAELRRSRNDPSWRVEPRGSELPRGVAGPSAARHGGAAAVSQPRHEIGHTRLQASGCAARRNRNSGDRQGCRRAARHHCAGSSCGHSCPSITTSRHARRRSRDRSRDRHARERDVIARIEAGAVVDGCAAVLVRRSQSISWLASVADELDSETVDRIKNIWPVATWKELQIA